MGNYISQNFPARPTWHTDHIPDLSGQVIIVTGSNTGIGKVTVKELLKHNAKVYMAVRSREKAEAAIKDLKKETGKEAIFLKLDLGDLTTIKASVEDFLKNETHLHVLINNAGVAAPPRDMLTSQGYDLQFGVNTLGHFYFTTLLLPILTSTAQTTPDKKVRVVHVSSYAHHFYAKLDFNSFKDGPARRRMGDMALYGQSKTGNILLSNELARRYGDQGIVSISLHPGSVRSELQRYGPRLLMEFIRWAVFYPVELGSLTPLYAATAPECAEYNGEYLSPWARHDTREPDSGARNPVLAKELWQYMEEQVKGY
ncbi:NAD(P)-binding protein [Rhodocollybia butyracea]|uniref:NAD(P)-binding protein n=1 Tax=Rhodocollybia butyracea TaxID=206335 RepID=A0A9P5UAT5_9AGAR|nr:NAD(P)-binding protein [Rhodocollybia butyracea]